MGAAEHYSRVFVDKRVNAWYPGRMNKPLTRLQKKVFDFICEFAQEEGFPPSYQDIAQKFEFSSDGTVRTYLEHLENKGYIQRLGKARGLKILKFSIKNAIPILGKVAAGGLQAALEDPSGTIEDTLPELKSKEGRFALRVNGDSMKNAGILSGDLAIIQMGAPVTNGQIAVVIYEEEATLKRIYFEKDQVRLQPENDDYAPIIIERRDFEKAVCGRYIALIRKA